MNEFTNIPQTIASIIQDKAYRADDIGRSESAVFVFDDMVLKIEKTSAVSDNEYEIMKWLDGKLPTPRVIAFERQNGYNYLLMTKLSGKMACDQTLGLENIVKGLAAGLKMLWSLDIKDCPKQFTAADKLREAKKRMENSKNKNCEALYTYLETHLPEDDLVFSHGDYCLPNVFLEGETPVGFLDLGQAGVADRWQDIYWCVWSMRYNLCEFFGMSGEEYERRQTLLFEELGMDYDEEKIRWYQTLEDLWEASEKT